MADSETARLRDKYEARVTRLRSRLRTAEDRSRVLESEQAGRVDEEILSTAGSILGGLLRGRRSRGGLLGSVLGKAGSAAGRRSRTAAAGERLEAARHKAGDIVDELTSLEAELAADVLDIDTRWHDVSQRIATVPIGLERTDVRVVQLVLGWIPVS
jgi:hypothetical protein